MTAGAYAHRVGVCAAALALCTHQGGAVQLEAKDAGRVLLGRPLGPNGRICHQQQVRKGCAKECAVHIALIRPHMSQVLGCGCHASRTDDMAGHDKLFMD